MKCPNVFCSSFGVFSVSVICILMGATEESNRNTFPMFPGNGGTTYSVSGTNVFFKKSDKIPVAKNKILVTTLNFTENCFLPHYVIKVSDTKLVCHSPLIHICRSFKFKTYIHDSYHVIG